MAGKANIFIKHPEIEAAWDFENNTVSPDEVSSGSNQKVFWKCPNGHHFERAINTYINKTQQCPVCDKLKTMVISKPYLMKFWDKDKNTLDPSTTSAKSAETAYWKCPKCGYAWSTSVRGRNNGNNRDLCPCCETNMVVAKGINDFASVYPELGLDALQELNPGIDLGAEGVGSHKQIHWKCHICGYEWNAPIYGRIRREEKPYRIAKCPVCAKNKRALNFAEEYPALIPLYSERNKLPLNQICGDWAKEYIWKCEKHGEFTAVLSSMVRSIKTGNNGCPYCHGAKVKKEDSFGCRYPELLKEWSSRNTVSPFEITENSSYEALWQCDKGHIWKATVFTRTHGYGYCRECFPFGKHSPAFAALYPKLKKNYSPHNKTVFEVHSAVDVSDALWVCDQGHEFEDSFFNINKRGFRCPYCTGKKALPGFNDFQTLYPKYAESYDSQKNALPAQKMLPKSSNENTWWKCSKGHSFQKPISIFISQNGVCPVCERYIVQKGENDALTRYPELGKIWNYEVNTKKPDEIPDNSTAYFNFICDKGHHYSASIQQMAANEFKCLICTNTKLSATENSLQAVNPALAHEWSPNNKRGADSVLPASTFEALWVCPTCHGEYKKIVRERKVGDGSCPYCAGRQVLVGFNDLVTVDPELAEEWSDNNKIPVSEVMREQHLKALWICPACGGEYEAYVDEREVGDDACPYCNNQTLLKGYNDFQTVHPEECREWAPENDVKPDEVLAASSKRIIWKCSVCHGRFWAKIKEKLSGEHKCPYCSGYRLLPGFNDVATQYPEQIKEWSPDNDILPTEVMSTSNEPVKWVCPTCHGEYNASINMKVAGKVECPYCSGKAVLPGYNDLASTDPELAKEWSPNNDRDAAAVKRDSARIYHWICPTCHGEYPAAVKDRHVGDDACPYCNGRAILPGYNDLATIDPELAKEWSPNNDRDASTVGRNFTKPYRWICPTCHGEYLATIKDRYVGDDSCPYCSGTKILPGYNSFKAGHPDLMEEWSGPDNYLIGLDPDQLSDRSIKTAWWVCNKHGSEPQTYPMSIAKRVKMQKRHRTACPYCKGYRITRRYFG